MGGRRHKQWVLLVHLKWKSNFKRLAEFMWKESEKRRKRERTPKRTKIGGKEEERMQANGQKYCLAQMSCSERHCKSCGPEERQWSSITSCSVLNFRQEQREEWRGERTGMEKRGGEWEWNGQRKHLNHEKAVRKMMQRRRLLFCHVTQSADQIFWKHISFLPCSIPLTDGHHWGRLQFKATFPRLSCVHEAEQRQQRGRVQEQTRGQIPLASFNTAVQTAKQEVSRSDRSLQSRHQTHPWNGKVILFLFYFGLNFQIYQNYALMTSST